MNNKQNKNYNKCCYEQNYKSKNNYNTLTNGYLLLRVDFMFLRQMTMLSM
ncbi:MAG: hypothetical protein LBR30_06285 [Clostridioides sp.]|nr:hypothetical protein [Clostridioides sp.]